jgi:hypothetical protein
MCVFVQSDRFDRVFVQSAIIDALHAQRPVRFHDEQDRPEPYGELPANADSASRDAFSHMLSSSSAASEFESGMCKLSSAAGVTVSALVSSKESRLCVGASQVCSVACMACDLPVQRRLRRSWMDQGMRQ